MILNQDQLKLEGIAKGFGTPRDDMDKLIEKVTSGDGPCEKCSCHPYAVLAAAEALNVRIYVKHFPMNDSEDMSHVCIFDPVYGDTSSAYREIKIMWRVIGRKNQFFAFFKKEEALPTVACAAVEDEAQDEVKEEAKEELSITTLTEEVESIQLSTPEDPFEMQLKISRLQKLKKLQKKRKSVYWLKPL